MTEWVSTSSAELIETGKLEIGDGYRAKNSEFRDRGIPFLRIGNLGEGRLLLDGADLFPEEDLDKVAGKVSRPKDCVIATKATIGRLAYLDESSPRVLYSPQVSYWRVLDESVLEPRFIRCWLVGREFDAQAFQTKSSTSMADYINLRDQRRMRMTLPPLDTQRKIASVIAAYDELIENNLRRIEILEEMAHAVYREWFVNFRIPGYEEVALVDSPLGPIPEGWEVGTLDAIVENVRASTKAGPHLHDLPYVPIDCISARSVTLSESKPGVEAKSSLILFEEGDILFGAMRPYFHKVAAAPAKGVTRTTCFVLRPRVHAWLPFALLTMFRDETIAYATNHSRGTTIPYAAWDGSLADMTICLPGDGLLERFGAEIAPMLELARNLAKQNSNLRATRDLLLPKLVSGEIDVSDLDIDTEWLAS